MQSSIEQARSDNNTVLDGISDSLVNGFSKLKSKKEEFIKAQEKVERLEVNLQHVEKLHNNIIKQERCKIFFFLINYFDY